MLLVKAGNLTSTLQSRCSHNDVIISNHFALGFQFRPDTRMLVGGLLRVGDNGQNRQNSLNVLLTFRPMRALGQTFFRELRTAFKMV